MRPVSQYTTITTVLALGLLLATTGACGPGGDSEGHDHDGHSHSHDGKDAGEDTAGDDHDTGGDTASNDQDASGNDLDTSRETSTENGTYFVTYTPEPDPIPVKELFKIRVEVYQSEDQETMVEDANVSVEARMPAHGHGMPTEPEIKPQDDGSYLVEGMKFQMHGMQDAPWLLEVTVEKSGESDMASYHIVTEQ